MALKNAMKLTACTGLLLAGMLTATVRPEAQIGPVKKEDRVLLSMRFKDIDGNQLSISEGVFKDKRFAICVVATWSDLSIRQAEAVLASAAKLEGPVLIVAAGNGRLVRDLRVKFGPDKAVFASASQDVRNLINQSFDTGSGESLDRVPGLLVIDEKRRVVHSSLGELDAAGIDAALTAKFVAP